MPENVKTSGLAGTSITVPLATKPLLFTTTGYEVPAGSAANPGGTTNVIECSDTDFSPAPTPLIVSVTPLSSIGSVKLRLTEPTAVRATTGWSRPVCRLSIANIPGANPCTADGVTGVGVGVGVTDGVGVGVTDGVGVGVGVGVGLGVGVAVGVAVGDGVGTGDGETGMRLAPVAKLSDAAVC